MIKTLKLLFKDSLVYGVASVIQKITPVAIIPIITTYLGKTALKIYDLSFVYTYLFSLLVVAGLDSAASVFYFDERKQNLNKKQVLSYAFFMQVFIVGVCLTIYYPFRDEIAAAIFTNDAPVRRFWFLAMTNIPGHVLLNYGLNVLIWQRRKGAYVFICILQALLTIAAVYLSVVIFGGSIVAVIYSIVGVITLCGLIAVLMIRKEIFVNPFPLDFAVIQKLFLFGLPFALNALFKQFIYSIDRYFLIRYHILDDLPQYILAVKISSFISTLVSSTFILVFTPYSLNKLNDDDAEHEISGLFRFIAMLAFTAIPVLLLFKDLLVDFFADGTYQAAAPLFPFFFFGWVFDLFTYFTMLGIYKSQKSFLILVILLGGATIISSLNVLLVPVYGVYGAALSFCITKICLFFITFFYLMRFFKLHLDLKVFLLLFLVAAIYSYLAYTINIYLYVLLISLLLGGIFLYIRKSYNLYQLRNFINKKAI